MDYSNAIKCAVLAREIYQEFDNLSFSEFENAHLERIEDPDSDTQCIIIHEPDAHHLYIVFRGTESNNDWKTNVKFTRNLFQIRNLAEEMAAEANDDDAFIAPPPAASNDDASMFVDTANDDDAFTAPPPAPREGDEEDADMHFEEVDDGGNFTNFMNSLAGRRQEHQVVSKYPRAQMHNGFVQAMITIQDRLHNYVTTHEPKKITVTGHSLGGALATLCALDMQLTYDGNYEVEVCTFGSPRVGNAEFQALFNESVPNSMRVVNGRDIVPTIPTELQGYRHVAREINLEEKLTWRVLSPMVTDHFMPGYIEGLKKLQELND